MVFICAVASSASRVATSIIDACSGQSERLSSVTPGIFASRCFWKKSSPPVPDGPRTSDTGRPFKCGRMKSATLS